MPPPQKSWFRSGARFCASCAITLCCWTVWIVLGVTLVSLTYVAVARDLPVPDMVLRRVEARLAESGLVLRFGRAHFDPTGKVLLEDVQFRSRQFDDPLLTCRLLYVRHNFWTLLAGRIEPEEIRLEGAALQLPAMFSPSGTTEPFVKDLTAVVRYENNTWQVDQFIGRIGQLTLTLQGELPAATSTHGRTDKVFSLDELTGKFLQLGRQLAPNLRRLDAFEEPSLAVRFSANRADLLLTAKSSRQPWDQPVTTGALAASTTLRLNRAGVRPLRVHVAVDHVNYGGQVVAENVRALLRAEVLPESFSGRALELQGTAASVSVANETVLGPVIRADLADWPTINTRAMAQIDGEFIAAEVEAKLQEQSARISAEGRVSAGLIKRLLAEHTPRAAPYFLFGDPVAFKAEAVLSPGWQFATLASRVEAGRINSHGVQVTAARGRIDIAGLNFLAYEARAMIGANQARGSYWMNFATTNYRMLLDGRLNPLAINGWFLGDWWLGFWNKYFAFPAALPEASVDIGGRWKTPALSNNYIQAHAAAAKLWGGDFEQADATVFVRPNFAHAWTITARRAAGTQQLSGSFKRFGATATRDNSRFEFDFTGNPDPAVVGRMLEGRIDDVLASLRFSAPPEIHAWGTLDQNGNDYHFTGEARSPLSYFNFPLETVKVSGAIKGPNIELDQIAFTAAGGSGTGRASLSGAASDRRLGFEVFVNGAKLDRTIHGFEEFSAGRAGRPYVASPDSQFLRKAAGSQLDLAFSAQGTPSDINSFKGSGNAALTGAELGEVHLFGLLSQVLSGLSLSFSSLKLDAARASFNVHDGAVFFPDLKVTGPSAVIDARGKYSFAANALDFNAKFKPYDQPGSLLAAAVSLVINPLTSILELRLSGPLAEPKWSVEVTSPSSKPKTPDSAKPSADAPRSPIK